MEYFLPAVEVVDSEGTEGGETLTKKEVRVKTVDGLLLACTGTDVDGVEVFADQELKIAMATEIRLTISYLEDLSLEEVQAMGHKTDCEAKIFRCPLCPLYSWKQSDRHWKERLLVHITKRHTPTSPYATGTLQKRVVMALFNRQRMLRKDSISYLADSAALMRQQVPHVTGWPDREIAFVFESREISFRSWSSINEANSSVLHIGNHFCTKGFAELFFTEFILCGQKLKFTIDRIKFQYMRSGVVCSDLLPRAGTQFWRVLAEKIILSDCFQQRKRAMILECVSHFDCNHISIDGLIRPTRNIVGQADYRSSKALRAEAFIPDADSIRTLLGIRSRTSAALAIVPAASEKDINIVAVAMKRALPVEVLHQVQTLSLDDCKEDTFKKLKEECLVNLQFIALDPYHLVIHYKSAHGRTKTKGAAIIGVIQNKFNNVLDSQTAEHFELPFVTGNVPWRKTKEAKVHDQLCNQSMPTPTAKARLAALDGNTPYLVHFDYIADLAALCSIHREEVQKKTAQQGKPLWKIIASACCSTKIGYYFNNLVRRAMIPIDQRAQLASGTSACESLNKEINNRFDNAGEHYQSTLEVACEFIVFEKLLAHNSAEYMPAARQCSQREVLQTNLASFRFTAMEWSSVLSIGSCPLHEKRLTQLESIRKAPTAALPGTRKRPAVSSLKRQTFNKKRVRVL
jgi:hypothetical protein